MILTLKKSKNIFSLIIYALTKVSTFLFCNIHLKMKTFNQCVICYNWNKIGSKNFDHWKTFWLNNCLLFRSTFFQGISKFKWNKTSTCSTFSSAFASDPTYLSYQSKLIYRPKRMYSLHGKTKANYFSGLWTYCLLWYMFKYIDV